MTVNKTQRQAASKNLGSSRERESGRPGGQQSLCFIANDAEFSLCLFVHLSSLEGVEKEKRKPVLTFTKKLNILQKEKQRNLFTFKHLHLWQAG